MAQFIVLTCLKCGGKIQIHDDKTWFSCPYCGTPHIYNPDQGMFFISRIEKSIKNLEIRVDKTTPPLPNPVYSIPQTPISKPKNNNKPWILIIIIVAIIAVLVSLVFLPKLSLRVTGPTEPTNPYEGNWYYSYYIKLHFDSDFSVSEYADNVIFAVGTYIITGNNSMTMTLCDPDDKNDCLSEYGKISGGNLILTDIEGESETYTRNQ